MGILGSVITRPKFRVWEVRDNKEVLSLDRAQAEASPCTVVMEALHKVAYR